MTFTLKRQEIVRDFRNRWKILSSIKAMASVQSFQEMCESSNHLSARTKLSHSGRRSIGSEGGREHFTGVPGALKCSLAPSMSWEPSPHV